MISQEYLWYVVPQANGTYRAIGFKPNSQELNNFLATMCRQNRPVYFMEEAVVCLGTAKPKARKKVTPKRKAKNE